MKRKGLVLVAAITVLCVAGIVATAFMFRPATVIPKDIQKQANFALFVPDNERMSIDKQSVKYDAGLGLLSFTGTADGVKYVMAEQATPTQFSEIPQYYEKLRDNMNQYASFDTVNGTVYLTRPAELQGKQAAILNEKGTLMSVRPDGELTEDQWRKFFNTLELIH